MQMIKTKPMAALQVCFLLILLLFMLQKMKFQQLQFCYLLILMKYIRFYYIVLFKAITLKNFVFAYCLLILYFNKSQICLMCVFCLFGGVFCFSLTCFIVWSCKKNEIISYCGCIICVRALAIENGYTVPFPSA